MAMTIQTRTIYSPSLYGPQLSRPQLYRLTLHESTAANPIDLKYDNTKNENLKEFRMRCKLQCTEMAQHVGTIRTGP